MESQYSEQNIHQALLTLKDTYNAINQLMEWNNHIESSSDYHGSVQGMQLLAANCMLITAIGEGINRCHRMIPDFLSTNFPDIPWKAIVGMRNHICHGYFELDAEIVFSVIKDDLSQLLKSVEKAIEVLSSYL